MQQGYTHPLQGLLRRRLWPERATQHFVSARVLLRCHCAATSDSLRCDARSTRRAAGTRAPPQNTHDVRTACAVRMRGGDASCRGTAPALWVLQASTRSRRARARVRVRVSQGPSLPRPVFRYTTERAGRLGGARPTERPKGGYGLARVPSSGGAPVAPWCRGEASSWSPVVEKKSNGRTALAAVKTLESTTWLA